MKRKRKTHAEMPYPEMIHSLCGLYVPFANRKWTTRPTCLTCRRILAAKRKGK